MDSWKEDRLIQMDTQLNKEMIETKEALTKLQAVVKGHHEARSPFITTVEASTMIETIEVSLPSLDII